MIDRFYRCFSEILSCFLHFFPDIIARLCETFNLTLPFLSQMVLDKLYVYNYSAELEI